MRVILATVLLVIGIFNVNAQVVNPTIKINLDVSKLTGMCNLGGASVVYCHSGVGTSGDTAVWEHIVGHWGRADGIGKMTSLGNGKYSICFNIYDYYKTATIDTFNLGGTGTGPMHAGDTARNIGLVFREEGPCPLNGAGEYTCIEGKDPNCRDIYIIDILSGQPYVNDKSGNPFPAVTVELNAACATGINDVPSNNAAPTVYPNPFTDFVRVEFNLSSLKNSKLELFDILGNRVADFTSTLVNGYNSFAWDGSSINGKNAPAGVYFLKLQNGNESFTQKVVKQ